LTQRCGLTTIPRPEPATAVQPSFTGYRDLPGLVRQLSSLGGCAQPIRLEGHRTKIDAFTGETSEAKRARIGYVPESGAIYEKLAPKEYLTITGELYGMREKDIQSKISELLENQKDKIVLIKADEEVEYGAVMAAMDQLRQAGVEDIGLITERKRIPGQTAGGK